MYEPYRNLHDFSHTSWKRENVKFDMRATKLVKPVAVKNGLADFTHTRVA